jgi:hypothetical protein
VDICVDNALSFQKKAKRNNEMIWRARRAGSSAANGIREVLY